MTMFVAPIETVGQAARMLHRATTSAHRVFEVLDTEPDVRDQAEAIALHDLKGKIEFRDVTFGYDGVRQVLRGISFEVKPGELIGLVGPSGGGKTTLVNLLTRFYDVTGGQILIDGVDVRALDSGLYRSQVGIVLQDPYLFHGSILENIRYGMPDATFEQVIAAVRAANAHDFVCKLPLGYDTIVGERGHTLSGGERQRISIARAVLRNPRILILDEATSAVDTETERKILEALDRLVAGRTVFAIAHRLSTLRKASRLFVIENGKLAEAARTPSSSLYPTASTRSSFAAGSPPCSLIPHVRQNLETSSRLARIERGQLGPGSTYLASLERRTTASSGSSRARRRSRSTFVRCFPWTEPRRYLSLREQGGRGAWLHHERGGARRHAAPRRRGDARSFELVLQITAIHSVEEDFELRSWRVETAHGPRTFQTPLDGWPRELDAGGLVIEDVYGDSSTSSTRSAWTRRGAPALGVVDWGGDRQDLAGLGRRAASSAKIDACRDRRSSLVASKATVQVRPPAPTSPERRPHAIRKPLYHRQHRSREAPREPPAHLRADRMGIILVGCGICGFLDLLPQAVLPSAAADLGGSLFKAGFMYSLLKGTEVLLQVYVNRKI